MMNRLQIIEMTTDQRKASEVWSGRASIRRPLVGTFLSANTATIERSSNASTPILGAAKSGLLSDEPLVNRIVIRAQINIRFIVRGHKKHIVAIGRRNKITTVPLRIVSACTTGEIRVWSQDNRSAMGDVSDSNILNRSTGKELALEAIGVNQGAGLHRECDHRA